MFLISCVEVLLFLNSPWHILPFGEKSNVLETNKPSEKNQTRGVTCQKKKTNKAYK